MRAWLLAALCVAAAAWFGLASPAQQAWFLPISGLMLLAVLWDRDRSYRWSFIWIMALVALTAVVLASQILITADPAARGLDDAQRALLGDLGQLPVARDRDAFLSKLGLLFLVAFAFLAGLAYGSHYGRALRFLRLFILANAILAFLTLVLYFVAPQLLLWEARTAYQGYYTFTFVNRNTAATYLGLSAILSTALLARDLQDIHVRQLLFSLFVSPSALRRLAVSSIAVHTACILVFVAGLFATGSRGGIAASLIGLAAFALVYIIKERRWMLGILFGGAAVFVVAFFVMQNEELLIGRFEDPRSIESIDRYAVYRSTAAMIRDHINQGVGYGGFASSFPEYRSENMTPNTIFDLTHSTPLQVLVENGLWYTIVVAAGWLAIAGGLAYGVFVRQRRHILPAAGLSIWVLTTIHMAFDFSPQIAGFAIACFVALGISYAQAIGRPVSRRTATDLLQDPD